MAETSFLRRNPILSGLLSLVVVGTLFGGWIAYRIVNTPKKQVEVAKGKPTEATSTTTTEPTTVSTKTILAQATPSPAMGKMDDDTDPDDPDEDKPLEFVKPDPDFDKFVAKEAKTYESPAKPAVKLGAVAVTATSARKADDVARKLDTILDAKLAEMKIPASPRSSDSEFLRRVYLDITGSIPPSSKVKTFLASTDPTKRTKLVDELLNDTQFGENFAHYWHDLLVKRDPDSNKTIKAQDVFVKWLTHQFNNNKPWNETVRAMITATGDQALVGETFFILANAENNQPAPNKLVGTASALFLGNQMMCAECHVHPMIPEWKQDDFWGLAAFFGKTRAQREATGKKATNAIAKIVDTTPATAPKAKKGAVAKPMTAADGSIPIPDPRNDGKFIGTAKPKYLDGKPVSASEVSRKNVADWFVSKQNPFFARAAVNRLWSQFFGRGFINPLDDIRPDSVASHPEALELLAEELIASGFDVKHMIRVVCATEAYQRSSQTSSANHEDHEYFSHMEMKVLAPRHLFKSLGVATSNGVGTPTDPEPGAKPTKQDTNAGGLTFFDAREYDEYPGEYTFGVPQLLRLMNRMLPPACDAATKNLSKLGSRDKVIEHLYLSSLSRMPTSMETKKMNEFITKQGGDPQKAYANILWVLLSSAEFINNH